MTAVLSGPDLLSGTTIFGTWKRNKSFKKGVNLQDSYKSYQKFIYNIISKAHSNLHFHFFFSLNYSCYSTMKKIKSVSLRRLYFPVHTNRYLPRPNSISQTMIATTGPVKGCKSRAVLFHHYHGNYCTLSEYMMK